ncbi:hypothetical protein MMC31_004708, partial [Peltigera leucophlebia]|nr:hypothetical protein [Peltigera leucophlebia]
SDIASSPPNQLPSPRLPTRAIPQFQPATSRNRASSPIVSSEGLEAAFLDAWNLVDEKQESAEYSAQVLKEKQTHQEFLGESLLSDDESTLSDADSDWEEDPFIGHIAKKRKETSEESGSPDSENNHGSRVDNIPWVHSIKSNRAREKLVRILNATLVQHRNDKQLKTPFRQFRRFAYEIMMVETDTESGQWPKALGKKDWDRIIHLRGMSEAEKRYGEEVQALCKTPGFGLISSGTRPGEINKASLEGIVKLAKTKAPIVASLVRSVGPLRARSLNHNHLIGMKLVTILVILCRSAHRNNSNFLPLLIAIYLYSAGAQVDVITLLNHLGLTVSYDVLLSKLWGIASDSALWIKQQAQNPRLVGTWDNFEYRENVHGERVGNKVKFRSITMALWIKNGWKIPPKGLKQLMWVPRRNLPQPAVIINKAFGPAGTTICNQCIRHHRFGVFLFAFSECTFDYSPSMPAINRIDCQTEGATEAFAFAPSMHSESTTVGNMAVFEDLTIHQMGLKKEDPCWGERLTLWWGDLKTEVQILSMQAHGVRMNRPYKIYRHIMPGLALWHLRYNYLKMVWELFYPGGSPTERSTLQWAADHWHRDKTTRPTDFHSLEDLTIHSYRARIIAILKSWIHAQEPSLKLHESASVGT